MHIPPPSHLACRPLLHALLVYSVAAAYGIELDSVKVAKANSLIKKVVKKMDEEHGVALRKPVMIEGSMEVRRLGSQRPFTPNNQLCGVHCMHHSCHSPLAIPRPALSLLAVGGHAARHARLLVLGGHPAGGQGRFRPEVPCLPHSEGEALSCQWGGAWSVGACGRVYET